MRRDLPVSAAYMTLPEARALGALALFGETYDEQVRVVEMGGPWSRELCGGTHVSHSSQVGPVVLTGEASVGAGVRRVEALVGIEAFRSLAVERALLHTASEALKVRPEELPERVAALAAQLRAAEKKLSDQAAQQVLAAAGSLAQSPTDVFGVAYVGHDAGTVSTADDVRALALDVRGRLGDSRPSVVAVSGVAKDRPVVVVATNATAREWGVKAGALVRVAAQALGGGGGGKDDLAQGGGTDPSAVPEALRAVEHAVGETVTAGR